jgi:hypothetical protein
VHFLQRWAGLEGNKVTSALIFFVVEPNAGVGSLADDAAPSAACAYSLGCNCGSRSTAADAVISGVPAATAARACDSDWRLSATGNGAT